MDPISEMLVSIKNALTLKKDKIEIPFSNIKLDIAKLLVEKGFLRDAKKVENSLVIKLRYSQSGTPEISNLQRASKPSRRIYLSHNEIPKIKNGLGMAVISTSHGVMEGNKAKKLKIGGEFICTVW